MKYRVLAPLGLTAFLAASSLAEPITLEDAVREALASSRELHLARLEGAKAEARLGQARSALQPQASATAQALLFSDKNEIDLGAMMGMPGMPPFTISKEWNPSLAFQLTYPIDISGSLKAARTQAQFGQVAAKISLDRVRNEVAFRAQTAWLEASRASQQLDAARKGVARAEIQLKDAENSHKAGFSPRFEVVSAMRDLAEARQRLAGAEGALQLARVQLALALGRSPLADVEAAPWKDLPTGPLGDPLELSESALKARPELQEIEAKLAASEQGIVLASSGSKPTLGFSLGWQVQPNHGVFTKESLGSASLTFSMPLYDGRLSREKAKEAKAAKEGVLVQKAHLQDAIRAQVKSALVQRQIAQESLNLAKAGLAQAHEAYRIARQRYEAGVSAMPQVSPQLEVISAEAGLAQAESALANSMIDLALAQASLDFALGVNPLKP